MSDTDAMKKQEAGKIALLLSYIFLFLCAAGLFVSANAIPASRFEKLGAGAFPKIVFATMAVVAAIAIIGTVREIPRSAYAGFFAQTVAWARRSYLVFISLGALTVYLLVIPVLGFSIASMLFLFGLQLTLMPRSAKSIALAAVVALVFSFGLNWVFAEVFTVFLPRGVL